jgi:predicted nucleic-acid-binding protein
MHAVDTNVLVRLLTRDDAGQVAAADRFVEKGAWVSLLALVETTWVLDAVYQRSAIAIGRAVELLLSHQQYHGAPIRYAAISLSFRTSR